MIDIEAVLVAWLEENVEGASASTETPSDLDDNLPWLLVHRISGPYDGYRVDRPSVDIATFHTDGPAALNLARQVQALLHNELAGSTYQQAVINKVKTNTGPHRVPYDNPNMRRAEASYEFAIHPA
ncbi:MULTISPECIES: hypothetical protein [Streptosporangiaceae]|uniref:hypothetical protein n=1 Tax=Streptosporangiaceae TaxID=2004 RepID=UPI0033E4425C